jgi:hypothetical protein
MKANSTPSECNPAQAKPVSQSARELALRRWRSDQAGQSDQSMNDGQPNPSPARLLAHHRWGTPILPLESPVPESTNLADEPVNAAGNDNFTIFAVLTILALIVFFVRKENVRKNRPSVADGSQSVHDVLGPVSAGVRKMPQAWNSWLIAGSIITAMLLLISSRDARRHWGWIAGALALMLSVMVTPEAPPR